MLTTEIIPEKELSFIDLDKYAGKWFVIASIPTFVDKNWNYVTETYALNAEGTIDVYTNFKKSRQGRVRQIKARAFPDKQANNFRWKVRLIWPFTKDYLIEEIAPDYSYVVVGHPKKEFLYIMSRNNSMDEETVNEIVKRCKGKGYKVSKLRKIDQ